RSYEVHIKPPLEERGGGWGWGDFVPHNIGKCCKHFTFNFFYITRTSHQQLVVVFNYSWWL
ncbi:MAG: hypothetical protein ACKOQS_01920, partial [Dolichospermum sp.]